jgi:hypothetical protein
MLHQVLLEDVNALGWVNASPSPSKLLEANQNVRLDPEHLKWCSDLPQEAQR